ncbi:hypothetical protein OsccyDRAFT_3959 [Leptolyngbyaceae cyanobacterium JSC-12]|nr:hypothetical protein OsccyDRAFT_3959 [Leptolyngbyaceae cyanobacterium JSC-12]
MSPLLEKVLAEIDQLDFQEQLDVISYLIGRWQGTVNQLPLNSFSRQDLFGCLRGKVVIADDFNAPLKDFAEYME